MIGLGGGSLAKFCYQHLPEAKITVVEINPHVIALRKEFMIPDDNHRFKVVQADGADYIRQSEACIDVLLVDGFDHRGQPPQLCSKRFYSDCRVALTRQGVMAINFHEFHPLYETFLDRVDTAFESNLVEVATNDTGNVIVFASKGVEIAPGEFRNSMDSFYSELSQWDASYA
jgi:spermidine synthase